MFSQGILDSEDINIHMRPLIIPSKVNAFRMICTGYFFRFEALSFEIGETVNYGTEGLKNVKSRFVKVILVLKTRNSTNDQSGMVPNWNDY